MVDMIRKIKCKRLNGCEQQLVGQWAACANCEKAWLHPGWEDTLLRRYNWLYEMTKRRKRMEAPKVDQSYD